VSRVDPNGPGRPATCPQYLSPVARLMVGCIVVIGNLLVDLLYSVLDPRVGIGRSPERTKTPVGGVF